MKKLLILSAIVLLAGTAFGQTLQKGNLIGVHVMTIDLKPGVTMQQYTDFILNTYIPAFEKEIKGVKLYLIKGVRGEKKNSLGVLFLIKSQAIRDKYFKGENDYTAKGQKALDNLAPVIAQGDKLGKMTYTYTDWVIQ